MSRTLSLVMTVLLVGAGSTPAWSQVRTEVLPNGQEHIFTTFRVPYGDLDLTTDAGADALLKRIALAATRACSKGGPTGGVMANEEGRARNACRARAVAQAVAQTDSPRVAARYAEREPGTVTVAQARP